MIRHTFAITFRASHEVRRSVTSADDPEQQMHGHLYDAEFTVEHPDAPLDTDGDMLRGDMKAWIERHFHNADLSLMDMATTPSQLAAYLHDVGLQYLPTTDRARLASVTLTVDRADRYTFTPDPE